MVAFDVRCRKHLWACGSKSAACDTASWKQVVGNTDAPVILNYLLRYDAELRISNFFFFKCISVSKPYVYARHTLARFLLVPSHSLAFSVLRYAHSSFAVDGPFLYGYVSNVYAMRVLECFTYELSEQQQQQYGAAVGELACWCFNMDKMLSSHMNIHK